MVKVDKNLLENILTDELAYSDVEAELYAERYPDSLSDELEEVYEGWLKDRTVADKDFGGISAVEIMEVQNCHFFEALRYLNALLRLEDEEKREKVKQILKESKPIIW